MYTKVHTTNLFVYFQSPFINSIVDDPDKLKPMYEILESIGMQPLDKILIVSVDPNVRNQVVLKYQSALEKVTGRIHDGVFLPNQLPNLVSPPPTFPFQGAAPSTSRIQRPISQQPIQLPKPAPKLDLHIPSLVGSMSFGVSKQDLITYKINWPQLLKITDFQSAIQVATTELKEKLTSKNPYISTVRIDDTQFENLIEGTTQKILKSESIQNQDPRLQALFAFLIKQVAEKAALEKNKFYESYLSYLNQPEYPNIRSEKYQKILETFINNLKDVSHQTSFDLSEFKLKEIEKYLNNQDFVPTLFKQMKSYYLQNHNLNAVQLLDEYVNPDPDPPKFLFLLDYFHMELRNKVNQLIADLNFETFAKIFKQTFDALKIKDFCFMAEKSERFTLDTFHTNAADTPEEMFKGVLEQSEMLIFLTALAEKAPA